MIVALILLQEYTQGNILLLYFRGTLLYRRYKLKVNEFTSATVNHSHERILFFYTLFIFLFGLIEIQNKKGVRTNKVTR